MPPAYDGMIFIGAIANARPSDVFHPGWSLNPLVNVCSELKLVIELKPIAELEESVKITQETDLNKEFAKKVAQNLFNYLTSFKQD